MEAATFTAPAALVPGRGGRLLRLRTDDQLVALFRFGNDEAFAIIHDRYQVRLLAYTRQMLSGSRADAEDALQDVFLRAYGALRADDRPVTLRAWLYRVAHNRCIDHMRRPANQPTSELVENVHSLHDPTAQAEQREDLARLVEDVRRLPEQQRSALLMRELEGLTYAELADALDVSVPSVKSLLVRARIGLTEAREARDTACVEIRSGISDAHDRGVRVTGQIRRHIRDCEGCGEYRAQLKRMREGFAALGGGGGGWASLAKLVGIGGAGSSAAATGGGGAAAGGSLAGGSVAGGSLSGGSVAGGSLAGGSVATGSLAAVGGSKVAAIISCAAVFGGGAVEASQLIKQDDRPARTESRSAIAPIRATAAASPVVARTAAPTAVWASREPARLVPVAAVPKVKAPAEPIVVEAAEPQADAPAVESRTVPVDPTDAAASQAAAAGGLLAPDSPSAPTEPTAPPTAAGGSGHAPATTETPTPAGAAEPAAGSAATSASVVPAKASASTGVPATGTTGPG